eukprot:TRINITY_DN33266_c1_g1_i1.p2 TRINITY_DN33266_c1_g1~~TRINITY_DN33266_c1_g1_i1.p2  ORF type:complete len:124 (-),score=14.94 TRINITY_DN33266_c1_g1_i1:414-785(-)
MQIEKQSKHKVAKVSKPPLLSDFATFASSEALKDLRLWRKEIILIILISPPGGAFRSFLKRANIGEAILVVKQAPDQNAKIVKTLQAKSVGLSPFQGASPVSSRSPFQPLPFQGIFFAPFCFS